MQTNNSWSLQSIPNQHGRTAIVTGANSGIGFIAARELAARGARVVLAVRDNVRGDDAAARILATYPRASVDVLRLDLANLQSIEAFSEEVHRRYDRIDVLLNNAGVMMPPYTLTTDGFELQIGVNHLGHFALTMRLISLLLQSPGSRVVNVSSGAHKIGMLNFDDLNWKRRPYKSLQAYSDSKIANLHFTFELQRLLAARQSSTIAVAAHPGVSLTGLQRHSRLLDWSSRLIAHDVESAALPSLRAATDTSFSGGEYVGPGKFFELRGQPERVQPSRRATDAVIARQLWDISTQLTGTQEECTRLTGITQGMGDPALFGA